jgi:endonuclease/exonuclease/phosphatase family metal-dependent hydrolase
MPHLEILSWNIQAAKGVDETTSVERIAKEIKAFSDADVICLQEVLCTPQGNQVNELAGYFPQHTPVFGAAIDRLCNDGRLQFGNMILSRLPIMQLTHHKLPQPAEPQVKHMPRQAIEVLVPFNNDLLRITTLHLDYFATRQRTAQVKYLAQHHSECCSRHQQPSPQGGEGQFLQLAETNHAIYCGDFNLTVDSGDYQTLTNNTDALIDCWRQAHGHTPHDPTCGIFDHVQWPEGAHCRDFFFASPGIAETLQAIEVNTQTAASDHQPLKIVIE